MTATPAADPMDSSEPPMPAVRVTSSHCPSLISGNMVNTANITGMLSITAEITPTSTLATVGPRSTYSNCEPMAR